MNILNILGIVIKIKSRENLNILKYINNILLCIINIKLILFFISYL